MLYKKHPTANLQFLNMEEQRTDVIHEFVTGVICSNRV